MNNNNNNAQAARNARAPLQTPKRMNQLDLRAFHRSHPPCNHFTSAAHFIFDTYIQTILLVALFCFEVFVVVFLMPGFGDEWMGKQAFVNDYAIPYGYTRYIFAGLLSALLLIQLSVDVYWKGLRVFFKGFLIDILCSKGARLFASLTSYKRWRFFRRIDLQLTTQERLVQWLVWSSHEWKRMLVVRIPFMLVVGMTLRNALTRPYHSHFPWVSYTAIGYLALRFGLGMIDLITKMIALVVYMISIRPVLREQGQSKPMPGGYSGDGTLTGYFRAIIQRHSDVIMANSFWPEERRSIMRRRTTVAACMPAVPNEVVLREVRLTVSDPQSQQVPVDDRRSSNGTRYSHWTELEVELFDGNAISLDSNDSGYLKKV